MAETFRCPSCAAPLNFEGKPLQKCPFCSSSVIAPSELFSGTAAGVHIDMASFTGRALMLAEIQREIRRGNKIQAIKLFRETFGTGLKEAKDAVEAIERGESVDLSHMQTHTIDLSMSPETVQAVKKAGVAVGGSIAAIFIVIGVLVVAAIGTGIYFALAKTNTGFTSTSPGSVNSGLGTPAVGQTPVPD